MQMAQQLLTGTEINMDGRESNNNAIDKPNRSLAYVAHLLGDEPNAFVRHCVFGQL
jgi:hypothetical protein